MRGAGWYSPGASSALTQIVHYSSSYYTVFHSVIYNSVTTVYCTMYIVNSLGIKPVGVPGVLYTVKSLGIKPVGGPGVLYTVNSLRIKPVGEPGVLYTVNSLRLKPVC